MGYSNHKFSESIPSLRFVFSLVFIVILTGCAVKPKPDANSVAHHHNLPANWTVKGRIALKTPDEKFSANMEWQQQPDSYRMRISKLIGGTLLVMMGMSLNFLNRCLKF